jgi:hypothetical protein
VRRVAEAVGEREPADINSPCCHMHAACQKRIGLPFHLSPVTRKLVNQRGLLLFARQTQAPTPGPRVRTATASAVGRDDASIPSGNQNSQRAIPRSSLHSLQCAPTIPTPPGFRPPSNPYSQVNATAPLLLACLSMYLRPYDAFGQRRISHHSIPPRRGLGRTCNSRGTKTKRLEKSKTRQRTAGQSAAPAGSRPPPQLELSGTHPPPVSYTADRTLPSHRRTSAKVHLSSRRRRAGSVEYCVLSGHISDKHPHTPAPISPQSLVTSKSHTITSKIGTPRKRGIYSASPVIPAFPVLDIYPSPSRYPPHSWRLASGSRHPNFLCAPTSHSWLPRVGVNVRPKTRCAPRHRSKPTIQS